MRSVAAGVAAMVVILLGTRPAQAGGGCPDGTTPSSVVGGICVPVIDPGSPGGGGGSTGGGGGAADDPNVDDPCEWSLASPQPPSAAPEWSGHSPEDGDLWMCVLPGWGNPVFQFRPDADAAPPDPAQLARRAVDQLRLTVPHVHMAPAPPAKTYVGLDTWLWMPPAQWITLNKSVTAGATTVRVTAEPKLVVWDMGDGSTTCHDAGRAWDPGHMPDEASTTCKYVYSRVSDFQPDKTFKITATITFDVTWRCTGNCSADEGSLGEVDGLPGESAISVGERQSVTTSAGGRSRWAT